MRLFLKILLYVFTVLIANVDVTSASITLPNIQETTTTLSFYGKTLKKVVGVIENDLANCCQNEQELVDYRGWGIGSLGKLLRREVVGFMVRSNQKLNGQGNYLSEVGHLNRSRKL